MQLKPGDKVIMNNKYDVSESDKVKVWTVLSKPWDCCGTLVVKLEGKADCYAVDGLTKVETITIMDMGDKVIGTVNILGTEYKVSKKEISDDAKLETCCAYCDTTTRDIVIAIAEPDIMNGDNLQVEYDRCVRHEIVHAFLAESGLDADTYVPDKGWATNEEMVDWFARQLPKIVEACKVIGAI